MFAVLTGCAHHHGADHGAHHDAAMHGGHHDMPVANAIGAQRLEEEMGIELLSLRTTAGGHMLDLRYKVTDTGKAHEVLREASKINIVIVDRANDTVAHVPKTMLGKLQTKADKARTDQVYYVIFENPHQSIQSGHAVDIHVGDVAVVDWPVL